MTIGLDINRTFRYKKETAGTANVAPGTTGGQVIRRLESSTFDLTIQSYSSKEKRQDYQRISAKGGSRSVNGKISAELANLSFNDFFAAAFKAPFAVGGTTGTNGTIVATVSGGYGTFTAGGTMNFLTAGIKLGDVGRWAGWTTTGTGNNAKNARIIGLNATQMIMADLQGASAPFAAKGSGDSVSFSVTGKKCMIPSTGHTRDTFYVEEWQSDLSKSYQFGGCVVSGVALNLPGSGEATVEFSFLGIDRKPIASAVYFNSPTAAGTTDVLVASSGKIRVNGVDLATITGLQINLNPNVANGQVVGSKLSPDIFPGDIEVSGQITAYVEDSSLSDAVDAETEMAIYVYLVATTSDTSPVFAIVLPRVKLFSDPESVSNMAMTRNYTFTALRNFNGGTGTTTDDSTIIVQDTEA